MTRLLTSDETSGADPGFSNVQRGRKILFARSAHPEREVPYTPIPQRARPLKDHETCLIFQWSFNELSMISEVFHDSWLIFQWSLWSPWSPKLFETVQNSLSAVFQENGLSAVFQRSLNELSKVLLVFPWSFDSLCYLVLSESLQQSRSVFQSSLGGLGQSFRVLSVVSVSLSEILIDLSKISGSMPDDLSVISQ